MGDPTLEAVAEGERRALRQWQAEHREPCDDCQWSDLATYQGPSWRVLSEPCPKHGGMPA